MISIMCQFAPHLFLILAGGLAVFLWSYWKKGRLLEIIRRSRDRFKNLVDLSPYGVALTARDGKIISANKALADLLEKDVRRMIGVSLPDLLGLDVRDVQGRASRLKSSEILKLPTIHRNSKDGETFHLLPCLFRDNASEDLLFWHVQDQTTYFELEKRFEELVESVPVGLFWADIQGRIHAVNPEFNNIFIHSSPPKNLAELLRGNGWTKARDAILTEGNVFKTGIELASGAETKQLKIEIKLCRHGSSHYLAGIVKDVTVEHKLQKELEEALKRAEAASRAKSTFLSHMSHEFRTPLNVIQGMATILEDKITSREALELVADLKKASEHLTALIGDILDLAKIESGKLSLEEKPFDLKQLIEDIEGVLGVQAGLKDLDFRVRFPDSVHRYYMGDPVRLRQIIFNLAGNAIKLTKKGWVEVAVSTSGSKHDKKTKIAITVSDTGPGIPEDVLSHLFDPFVQAEEGRKAGGTGLGLSIAKDLAEMMHGSIDVESVVGKGTEFRVEIMLEPLDACMVPEKPRVDDLNVEPGLALVADDVPMNRKILKMFLEKKGWQVREASNGREVLALLEREPGFDIVLMDVSMPEMDGVEAAQHMKKKQRWRRIPVIAVTAHAMAEDRKRFLDAGMDGYVSKPVRLSELMAEMAKVLPEKRNFQPKEEGLPDNERAGEMSEPGKGTENTPSETSGGEPVNYEQLLKTCQGMEDLARELLSDLATECNKWIEEARAAVEASDPKEIRRVCHLIRGSASTVHADGLSRAAEGLGQAARELKGELYSERLKALEDKACELEKWVTAHVHLGGALEKLEGLARSVYEANDQGKVQAAGR